LRNTSIAIFPSPKPMSDSPKPFEDKLDRIRAVASAVGNEQGGHVRAPSV